jgi:hypothetical protein
MTASTDHAAGPGTPAKLVYMANQIARFFSSQGAEA